MKRDKSRIFEVNKKLVNKMKAIKHLLTEEDKKLMDETDKAPPICNLGISNPFYVLYNPRTWCNVDPTKHSTIYFRLLKITRCLLFLR